MRIESASDALGIYISVPFCRAKCSFCNFASGVSSPATIERYVAMLCGEIDAAKKAAASLGADLPGSVGTVYFGGGTPSLLAPSQLREIFAALRRNFEVAGDAEITLESAPGQIADELLAEAMRLGVNRVSLGVQSFVDRESAAVGRLHTERECVREILRLRAAGLPEVGADLIAGLPYQTEESFAHSLEVASGVGLTHLSVYMLEVDEDSRLGREVLAGGQRFHAHGVPQEEIAATLYEQACAMLPQQGFAQYEISNFAAEEHQSRHNKKYWQRAPYMGFGLDAHSMLLRGVGAVRFANPEELADYRAAMPAEPTLVGVREAFEETVFLGLRMTEGISMQQLRSEFAEELVAPYEEAVRELVDEGLMLAEEDRWRLTLRGRLVSNEVFGHLLERLPG
ncbi:radical SAM family heme chaperone HemW [Granulicella mallensis]|uniref:Heme chaperone HemW n=1 Tax=Granulicella mallensis (strain ATCC BAA-1857 / DSM 23137 / MP5ACTX8) TaxID=682795 RepID=G8NNU5_GRAMM|nr:radical SAM family heme chaperone HemW [Granulicella mallensis]AEU35970.1 oxygen-independent coproporphyrinogen III oxidase [Granulicella mallensis MP5ACTX8]